MFKWQIPYIEVINLLQVTINVRRSHRQPQSTSQFVCFSSQLIFTLLYAGSSIQKASQKYVCFIQFYLRNLLFIQTHKQKPNGVRAADSNICITVKIQNHTHVQINLFLTMDDTIKSQNIDIFTWINLYIGYV